MIRLVVMTVVMVTIFAASAVGVRFYGSRAPVASADILKLGNCEEPCWHGIQIGHTTLDQARTLVHGDSQLAAMDKPPVEFGTCTLGWSAANLPSTKGCIDTRGVGGGSLVYLIAIYPENTFRLGDAINMFGTPLVSVLCFFPDPNYMMAFQVSAYLYFPGDIEVVAYQGQQLNDWRLNPEVPVRLIRYNFHGDEPPYRFDAPRWLGFTRYRQSCSE